MDMYSAAKFRPSPCPGLTPISDMSSLVTTTDLNEGEYKCNFCCLSYQKHSLLVQHNQVQFYDTIFLPGVVLGIICARKHFKQPTLKFVLILRVLPGALRPFSWHPYQEHIHDSSILFMGSSMGTAITSIISLSQRGLTRSLYCSVGSVKADIRVNKYSYHFFLRERGQS